MKGIDVDFQTVYISLVDRSYDRDIKTLCCPVAYSHGEEGFKAPLCDKCDIIFCYIYTNKLALNLPYLVRLDAEICIKMRKFLVKSCKNYSKLS